MSKSKFGHMKCPDCGERVVVKINDRETLAYRCDECDGNGYSKKGEGRYTAWMDKITRVAADPAPTPAAPPPAPKKDEVKKGADDKAAPAGKKPGLPSWL